MFSEKELEMFEDLVCQELHWIKENTDLSQLWAYELVEELATLKNKVALIRKNYKIIGGKNGTKN